MMEVKSIKSSETRELRHLVLWPHIQRMEDCIIDIDDREDAIHLGVFYQNKLISIGSIFRMNSPKLSHKIQYRLRAMATHPDYRKLHAGHLLLKEAIRLLKQLNAEVLWCDARLHATGFYQKAGFSMLPDIYEVKNIGPHQFMWFDLGRA